jgi:16S rRNA (guanine527-N7)-methyltransferase
MFWDDLPPLFPGFEASAHWLPRLRRHLEIIEANSARTRVTAVSADEAVRRHFAESLELLRLAEEFQGAPFESCADVGSGGGFPGLVIAAVRPALVVHLVEPLQKRARLLEELAGALDLPNVTVHPVRAEDAGRGSLRASAGLVTARAVAPLRELLEYTAPLAIDGGLLALPKGSGFETELSEATVALVELGLEVAAAIPMRPAISTTVRIALFRRRGQLSTRYPRRAGVPGKRPL